jgi:hypothetical protein
MTDYRTGLRRYMTKHGPSVADLVARYQHDSRAVLTAMLVIAQTARDADALRRGADDDDLAARGFVREQLVIAFADAIGTEVFLALDNERIFALALALSGYLDSDSDETTAKEA